MDVRTHSSIRPFVRLAFASCVAWSLIAGFGFESAAYAGCGGYVVLFRSAKFLPANAVDSMQSSHVSPRTRDAEEHSFQLPREGGECRGHSSEHPLPLPVSVVAAATDSNALPVNRVIAEVTLAKTRLQLGVIVAICGGSLDEIFEPPRAAMSGRS